MGRGLKYWLATASLDRKLRVAARAIAQAFSMTEFPPNIRGLTEPVCNLSEISGRHCWNPNEACGSNQAGE